MKNSFFKVLLPGTFIFFGQELAAQTDHKAAAEEVVHAYFEALNRADLSGLLENFASDAVLLPSAASTAKGIEGLKANYQYVFDNFGFNLRETIESVVVTRDHAIVRSTSAGSLLIKATGEVVQDNFREVFVLKKVKNNWKIDTYIYNQSK